MLYKCMRPSGQIVPTPHKSLEAKRDPDRPSWALLGSYHASWAVLVSLAPVGPNLGSFGIWEKWKGPQGPRNRIREGLPYRDLNGCGIPNTIEELRGPRGHNFEALPTNQKCDLGCSSTSCDLLLLTIGSTISDVALRAVTILYGASSLLA